MSQAVFADENNGSPSADDPLGYEVLYPQTDTDGIPVSMFYAQDEAMREEVRRLASLGVVDGYDVDAAQAWYRWRVGPIIRDRLARHGPVAGVAEDAVSMDYVPWVAYMVMADDAVDSLAGSQSSTGTSTTMTTRRATRNSMRTAHGWWLELDGEDRRAVVEAAVLRW